MGTETVVAILVFGILAVLILLAFLNNKDNELAGVILDLKEWNDFLYEAVIRLKNGTTVRKVVFAKSKLRKGAKVLLEPAGESFWKAKKVIY